MTVKAVNHIRNVCFIAQSGAGKSVLIERMLFLAKEVDHPGQRSEGNAVMSSEPEEKEHGFDITTHVGHLNWKDTDIHIVDTPGYFGFMEAARGALPGCDSAVIIVSAVHGLKPESKRLWKMLKEFKIPSICFITQLDHPNADYQSAIESISEYLGIKAVALSLPVGSGDSFCGLIDLTEGGARLYKNGKMSITDIPQEMSNEFQNKRSKLIESIAESDDKLIEKYLDRNELTLSETQTGLKNSLINMNFLPVLCGSGASGLGLEILIESIVKYLPSPAERDNHKPFTGTDPSDNNRQITRRCSIEEPFSAITLKTTFDRFSGKLSVIRVVSGLINSNQSVYNSTRDLKQKTGNIYIIQGNKLVQVKELSAGDIGGIAKLDETFTGDTLCEDKNKIKFPAPQFPQPLFFYAVKAEKNEEKVSQGLQRLAEEDSTLHYYRDPESGDNILAGMSQTHIDIAIERLNRKFSGSVRLELLKVPYRETISKAVKVQGRLKKQTGGHGQFADCWIEMEPLPRGSGFEFVDQIAGGIIPKQYIPSIEKGVREAMQKGALAGFPVTDFRVKVVDGSFHKVDSSDYAFQVAGSFALNAGLDQAEPYLLEPIMELQIVVSDEFIGDVVKDLGARRGRVLTMQPKDDKQEIHAEAPYAELLDYGSVLSAITSGRGIYVMERSHYADVPAHLKQRVLNDCKSKN